MFNQDKKQQSTQRKPKAMERNVIAKNTTIIGEIKSDGDFRIDGNLEGNLKTKGKVIIGSGGFVKGNIDASYADVEGKIDGHLKVDKTLTVKAIANISGDVLVGKLSIEPGATFNASCVMQVANKAENALNGKKEQSSREQRHQKKTFK